MLTNTPGHLESFDYLGLYRYSLTFCTDRRRPRFATDAVVDLVKRQILRAATQNEFAVIAYCFMPDHLHLLIEGRSEASDCKRFIALAKQYSGYYFKQAYRETLWQRYGFERVLRNDEATKVVAKYILENPIRGRLVERVEDYPYLGSEEYELAHLLEEVARSD